MMMRKIKNFLKKKKNGEDREKKKIDLIRTFLFLIAFISSFAQVNGQPAYYFVTLTSLAIIILRELFKEDIEPLPEPKKKKEKKVEVV